MRTWEQLTEQEQRQAIEQEYAALMEATIDGGVRWNDALNQNNMQAAIDAAARKAREMQTPWFAHEYIADAVYEWDPGDGNIMHETIRNAYMSMAECSASDAVYLDADENVIRLKVSACSN